MNLNTASPSVNIKPTVAGVLYPSTTVWSGVEEVASCWALNKAPTSTSKLSPGVIITLSSDRYSVGN